MVYVRHKQQHPHHEKVSTRGQHSERGKKTRQTEEEVGDNIREWTGLEFAKSLRVMENRTK